MSQQISVKKEARFAGFACLSMALAVGLGALGAHALKDGLSPLSLDSFQTGVRYQIVHSLAILIMVICGKAFQMDFRRPLYMMSIGMIMFSFSIYLLSTRAITGWDGIGAFIGWVTPVGGILLIASWIWSAVKVIKRAPD